MADCMTDLNGVTFYFLPINFIVVDVIKVVCPFVLIHGVACAPDPYCFIEPACGLVRFLVKEREWVQEILRGKFTLPLLWQWVPPLF